MNILEPDIMAIFFGSAEKKLETPHKSAEYLSRCTDLSFTYHGNMCLTNKLLSADSVGLRKSLKGELLWLYVRS